MAATATLSAYLLLYTAFDKSSKTLQATLLLDVLLLRRGLTHSLLELNKALSLAGLTVLALAHLPGFDRDALRLRALAMLLAHSGLSFAKLYGSKLWPPLSQLPKAGWPRLGGEGVAAVKFASIFFGSAAQASLLLGVLGYITAVQSAAASLCLGTAHFYTMEIDYKGVLQVRPFARVALLLPALALGWLALDSLNP
jgi:membrane-bound metal-dependent hydrolase YbcI (DUF457 family)